MLSNLIFYVGPYVNNARSFDVYLVCIYDKVKVQEFKMLKSSEFFENIDLYSGTSLLKIYKFDLVPGLDIKYKIKNNTNLIPLAIFVFFDINQVNLPIIKKIMCQMNKSNNSILINKNGAFIN